MTDTSSSSSSNSSSNNTPPSIIDNVLDSLDQSVQNIVTFSKGVAAAGTAAAGSILGSKAVGDTAVQQQKQAFINEGQATQDVNTIKGQADILLKNDNAVTAQTAGVSGPQFADSIAQIKNLQQSILSRDEIIKQKEGTSFLDSPLDWFANKFTLPFIESKQAAEVDEYKHAIQFLGDNQAVASKEFAINSTLDAAAGAPLIAAENKITAAKAIEQATQSQIDAAKFDTAATTAALSANNEALDAGYKAMQTTFEANQAARENARLNLEEENSSVSRLTKEQRLNIAQSEFAEREQKFKDSQDQRTSYEQSLTRLAIATGSKPMSIGQFTALPKPRIEANDKLMAALDTGGSYGIDPLSAVDNLDGAGYKPTTGGEALTYNFIKTTAAAEAAKYTKGDNSPQGWADMPNDIKYSIMSNAILGRLKSDYDSIPESGSIYSPPPLISTLKLPTVANTDIGKNLSAAIVQKNGQLNETYPTKPEDIWSTALGLVKSGKSAGDVATQLSTIGKSLQAATNAVYGIDKFSLPALGTAQAPNYNITVTMPTGEKKTVNLLNTAQTESLLTRSKIDYTPTFVPLLP
jgi:hypothetical protein